MSKQVVEPVSAGRRRLVARPGGAVRIGVSSGPPRGESRRPAVLRCLHAIPRCGGAFTPSTRLVSRNDGGGWFFIRFWGRSDRVGAGLAAVGRISGNGGGARPRAVRRDRGTPGTAWTPSRAPGRLSGGSAPRCGRGGSGRRRTVLRRPPRRRRASSRGEEVVGGFFSDFGAVRTAMLRAGCERMTSTLRAPPPRYLLVKRPASPSSTCGTCRRRGMN